MPNTVDKETKLTAKKPTPVGRFRDYAVGKFSYYRVIRVLIANKPKDKWQRPLLVRGLCADLLTDTDSSFARDVMVRYIGDRLSRRQEKLRQKTASSYTFLTLAIDRSLRKVLIHAFEPLGGITAIMKARSATELAEAFATQVSHAKSVMDLVSVMHLYASTNDKVVRHPKKMSVDFACGLVETLHANRKAAKLISDPLGASTLRRDRWDEMEFGALLIYAASLIEYDGHTFFDKLFSLSPKYTTNRLLHWLGVSKKLELIIRSGCGFKFGKKPVILRLPPGIKPKTVPPPKLLLCEALWLVWQFRQDPKEREWGDATMRVEFYARTKCSIAEHVADKTACAACMKFLGRFESDMTPVMRNH